MVGIIKRAIDLLLIGIIIGNLEVLLLEVTETIVNILVEKKSIIIKKSAVAKLF
jgi:hypothetical protein